jgi:hypothetical protein
LLSEFSLVWRERLKSNFKGWVWWYVQVIPVTKKIEMEGLWFKASPYKKTKLGMLPATPEALV